MKYTIFDSDGMIKAYVSHSDPELLREMIGDQKFVAGVIPSTQRYFNDVLVEIPNDPSANHWKYQYDVASNTWQIDKEQTGQLARQNRDLRLHVIDQVNPVRFFTLTDQQRQELQQYRQALLDVPQQPGFPTDIQWPAKPAWL